MIIDETTVQRMVDDLLRTAPRLPPEVAEARLRGLTADLMLAELTGEADKVDREVLGLVVQLVSLQRDLDEARTRAARAERELSQRRTVNDGQ